MQYLFYLRLDLVAMFRHLCSATYIAAGGQNTPADDHHISGAHTQTMPAASTAPTAGPGLPGYPHIPSGFGLPLEPGYLSSSMSRTGFFSGTFSCCSPGGLDNPNPGSFFFVVRSCERFTNAILSRTSACFRLRSLSSCTLI